VSARETTAPRAPEAVIPHRAVDPVMLFFDLVYVFLITELNDVLRAEPGGRGAVRAAVLLALVYWQWVLTTVQSSIRDASTPRHPPGTPASTDEAAKVLRAVDLPERLDH